jgi:hypothetical protein
MALPNDDVVGDMPAHRLGFFHAVPWVQLSSIHPPTAHRYVRSCRQCLQPSRCRWSLQSNAADRLKGVKTSTYLTSLLSIDVS